MSSAILWLPFAAQGAVMAADELHFHARRGLGPWERWGHPLDTLAFLACLALVAFASPTDSARQAYLGGAAFSTLLITKDEWVHAGQCAPGEHWLHALLFTLHPTALFAANALWPEVARSGGARLGFLGYFAAVGAFLAFQLAGGTQIKSSRIERLARSMGLRRKNRLSRELGAGRERSAVSAKS